MLIPITFNPKPSSSSTSTAPKLPSALAKISNDEVVLIELQGALEVEVAQPTDKNGKFVGKLTIDESGSVSDSVVRVASNIRSTCKWACGRSQRIFNLFLGSLAVIGPFLPELLLTKIMSLSFSYNNWTHTTLQGKPTLLIGHHLLEGKIAALTKPLAILTRSTTDVNLSATNTSETPGPSDSRSRGEDRDDSNSMDVDEDGADGRERSGSTPNRTAQWQAVGIVKKKIVFAKRPMPIVGRPS
ncbi:hypothetical protein NP233_g5148 [Leucocoprinus birnbaumii]|uniref:Chromosome transmission fidelity protein 8 n=1 Tax=Leucocoprinus birnbaumii TaxID=56174 RepID=A0AAD5YS63_9AGAR|nr:hypothetical protein NP233_g5148 [Leucocoprinus birnbaumii]